MKKIITLFSLLCTIYLVGCETTQEITIHKDGSGSLSNTSDMSNLVGMLKMVGGDSVNKAMQNTDTTISFAGVADSIEGLNASQKKVIEQGTMRLTLNMQDEKFVTKANFPFQKLSDLRTLNAAMPKVSEVISKKLPTGDQMPGGVAGPGGKAQFKTFDDFFDVAVTENLITKTLNKTKYATVSTDEYMQSLKQMSGMGSPITSNYVINLPRPAKKAEGKAVTLSQDKKKVTIAVTSDD